jgi:hypothetical protein
LAETGVELDADRRRERLAEIPSEISKNKQGLSPGRVVDPRLDDLEVAALLVEQHEVAQLLSTLAYQVSRDFDAEWVTVVDTQAEARVAGVGPSPSPRWLAAFVAGSQLSVAGTAAEQSPGDVAWANLETAGLAVVLGRRKRPFRASERSQLAVLARIADHRWVDLVARRTSIADPRID